MCIGMKYFFILIIIIILGLGREQAFCQSATPSLDKTEVLKLTEDLRSPDRETRYLAIVSLQKFGEKALQSAAQLATLLTHDSDVYIRAKAAQTLGEIGWQAGFTTPQLIEALEDPDGSVKYFTIQTLGKIGRAAESAGPRLIKFLKSSEPYLRYTAAAALGQIQYTKAVPSLSKILLKDPNSDVRGSAAEALGNMSFYTGHEKDAGIPELKIALQDLDPNVRAKAASALGNVGWSFDSPLVPLANLLRDADPKVRSAAIHAIDLFKNRDKTPIISQLTHALQDSEPSIRYRAAHLLSIYPEKKDLIIPHLIEALDSEDPSIRSEAIAAIESIGQGAENKNELIQILIKKLFDRERTVQESIVSALYTLGRDDTALASQLLDFLEYADIYPETKLNIVRIVSHMRVYTADVIAKLTPALKSPDRMLRQTAAMTLETIKDKLSSEEVLRLDPLLKNSLYEKHLPNLCRTLCDIASSPGLWTQDYYLHPDFNFAEDPWGFALQTLGALFVTKAAPFCPGAKNTIDGILYALTAEKFNREELPQTCDRFTFPFGDLQKFSNSILNLSGAPISSPQVYGKQFLLLMLFDLLRNQNQAMTPPQKIKLEKLLRKTEESLRNDLSYAPQMPTGVGGGSLFNTYAIATSMLADDLSIGKEQLKQVIDPHNALRIAYDPSPLQPFESPRASAARAVPTYLALYQAEANPSEKETFRTHLRESLDNYLHYLPSLMSHLRRGSAYREDAQKLSPHMGKDYIAPYYLFSTIPYVTAAAERLLQENRPNEREALLEIKKELKTAILSLVNDDGLFYTPEYASSPGYVNPLFGLSLIPLAEDCGVGDPAHNVVDPKALLGILN